MLKVWGRPNSINVQKVMWTIAELGLDHERIDAGGAFGGLDSDGFAALNPNRKIPVLEDGQTVVWESHACVRYLAARYGLSGLWPEDPAERAIADSWMEWKTTTILPYLHICFWGLIRTPEDQRDLPAIEAAAVALGETWGLFDRLLQEKTFVLGDELTMGDVPLGCAFYRYQNLPVERPDWPNIMAWYQRLKARAAFREHVMIPVT